MQRLSAIAALGRYVERNMHAIGSSYLIRQSPGSERIGGVTILIRPRAGSVGTLNIKPTSWFTGDPIEDDIDFLKSAAIEGLNRFATENAIELNKWDITVSNFAYHPVDSWAKTTQVAAYNAIATWYSTYTHPCESQSSEPG